jgi:polysaccharide export outer membrane protein
MSNRVFRNASLFLLLSMMPAFAQEKTAAAAPTDAAGQQTQAASRSDYTIGESDVLAINVWRDQELSRVLTVRPDGKITLPLIGEIQASGMTPLALQSKIAELLRDVVKNPEVTVIVQEPRSQSFNVIGEVQKPGTYTLGQRLTVLDALALAGGFRDFAKVKQVYVLRTSAEGKNEKLAFNYKKAVAGDISQIIYLKPHDTVVVP